jgi:ABC-type Fe3+-hydroxamate transport system substrate-binding protein
VHAFTSGATAEQIQDDFPSLSLREIYDAISYYLDHEEQAEEYLRRRDQEADQIRRKIEDRPGADAFRRRIRERYARWKAATIINA